MNAAGKPLAQPSAADPILDDLLAEFADKLQTDKRVDVDAFVRDHPAQPIPMPHQELLPRSAIAATSAGNQFLSVGIVRYDHSASLSNTDLPERKER